MSTQNAVLYRRDGTTEDLGPGDWDSVPGWNKMRQLLKIEFIQQYVAKLDGTWIKLIMDEDGKLKEGRVNLNATTIWLKIHALPKEAMFDNFIVGDVIVLSYARKPRG